MCGLSGTGTNVSPDGGMFSLPTEQADGCAPSTCKRKWVKKTLPGRPGGKGGF